MIDIKLTPKAIHEPVKHNAYYKVIIMLAIIKYIASKKQASIPLIHLVFWGIRTGNNYQILLDFSKKVRNTITPWSFEPGIENIISLALVNELCEKVIVSNTLELKLTEKGVMALEQIEKLELFETDIKLIKQLNKISKSRIKSANKNWTLI